MKFFANLIGSEEATESDPRKEVFLKLLQDSQENTCARVSFFDSLLLYVVQIPLARRWKLPVTHFTPPVSFYTP